MATLDLEKIIERLNDLQRRGVIGLHAIGGAFAFIFYAEPIETLDLDVFTDLPRGAGGPISLDRLYSELRSLGYDAVGDAILIEGFPVQILPEPTPLVHEAVAEARTTWASRRRWYSRRSMRSRWRFRRIARRIGSRSSICWKADETRWTRRGLR